MANCVVSGTFINPQGTAISGATVRFNLQTPVLDSTGNLLMPKEVTTTTAVDGTWSLSLIQSIAGNLTLDLNPTTNAPVIRYNFSLVIPATTTATFASCWADSSTFGGQGTSSPLTFASIAGVLATAQLPPLPSSDIWVGTGGGLAAPVAVSGDVSLTNSGVMSVVTVGGSTASNIHTGELAANAATSSNTASTILKRDGSGQVAATTFSGALSGNATTATSATSFSGSLAGDVTGTQSTTKVVAIQGSSVANTSPTDAQALLYNSSSTRYNPVSISGDLTVTNAGISSIGTNKVTNAKSAQMAAHTYKGNNTGSTANAADITSTQLTADLNQFTSSLQGLTPSSGGGTANFLRADGTFATPPGTGVTAVSVASANGFTGSSSGGSTPALTLTTSISGVLKGNGTAISSATVGSDYSVGTGSLSTGILKSTTSTGALSIAVAGDFPTLNQNTSGSAASLSATLALGSGGTGQTTKAAAFDALSPMTTGGDLIYGGSSGTGTRLANGTAGQVLKSNGTTLAPSWTTPTNVSVGNSTVRGSANVGAFGSSNTATMRWTNVVESAGSDITFTQSSTNGDKLTINTAGTYAISVWGAVASSTITYGIVKNPSAGQLTVGYSNTPAAGSQLGFGLMQTAGQTTNISATVYLAVNDLIYFVGDGNNIGNYATSANTSGFIITRVN